MQNAFLTVPCAEVIHTTLGPEFGADEVKMAVIIQVLYELMCAGASFRYHMADTLATCLVWLTWTYGISLWSGQKIESSIIPMCYSMWMTVYAIFMRQNKRFTRLTCSSR